MFLPTCLLQIRLWQHRKENVQSFQVILGSDIVPICEFSEKCSYTVSLVLLRQIDKWIVCRVRVPSVLQAKCNKMGMSQCLFFVKARDSRCVSLGTCLLWSGVGFTILGRYIGVGEESKTSIDTGRDPRRGQKFAILHPASTLLPLDARV